jgi:hypothetical protein
MTGAESLSLGTQPVTEAALILLGHCGVSPQKGGGRDLGSAAGAKAFPTSVHLYAYRVCCISSSTMA